MIGRFDRDNPPSLYIHIPFCRFRCAYCSFYSEVMTKRTADVRRGYFARLLEETKIARGYFTKPFPTVYIGGGTPNLDENIGAVEEILNLVSGSAEITVECNVSSVTDEQLSLFSERATRLSVGVQSLGADGRKTLCRFDDVEKLEMIFRRRSASRGFPALNLDFLTGYSDVDPFPGEFSGFRDWLSASGHELPEHVSLYLLTIEEGGAFGRLVRRGLRKRVGDDECAKQLLSGWSALKEAGYEHYEVSAFQRGGHRCAHNMNYWRLGEYLGLGSTAASRCFSKGAATAHYNGLTAAEFAAGRPFDGYEEERLTPLDVAVEIISTGLRTADGIDLAELAARSGYDVSSAARKLDGLKAKGGRVFLDEKQFIVSEYYIRKLTEAL